MGYTICRSWKSPKDIARELTAPSVSEETGERWEYLAVAIVGNHIWGVRQYTKPATRHAGATCEKYINLILVESMGGGLAEKTMDECMRPYYWDCPVELFSLAPAPSDSAKIWRAQVLERLAA